MITTLIVKLISIFLKLITALLPAWALPSYILEAFFDFTGQILFFNGYAPVVAFFQVIIIVISFEIAIITARIITGVMSLIRGGGKIEI